MRHVACDARGCRRGIVHLRGGWGNPCKVCGGRGEVTIWRLAKLLRENYGTTCRVLDSSVANKPETAARVCAALVRLCA